MAIITPDQSRQARKEFGQSQADVAEATGLKRQYLSEFESDTAQRFTLSQLKKLRAFYEGKLQAAKDAGEEIDLTFGDGQPGDTQDSAKVETVAMKRIIFCVPDGTDQAKLDSTLATIRANDRKLVDILTQTVEREDALFSAGDFTEDTLQGFRDSYELLATNYLLIRIASGWPELDLAPDSIGAAEGKILGQLLQAAAPYLQSAGLPQVATKEQEEEVQ